MTPRLFVYPNVALADELNIIMSTEDLVLSSDLDHQPFVLEIGIAPLRKRSAELELASDMTKKPKQ